MTQARPYAGVDAADRLASVNRSFVDAVDLGTPGDALGEAVRGRVASLTQVGIAPDDGAPLPLPPASVDLVLSVLALQFVNDLPGVLAQVRRALRPDGLLLAAMIGGDTLTELRQAFAAAEAEIEGGVSPRVSPFADVRDVGGLLQRAGFALPVVDVERLTVRYDNAFALMQDLRRTGIDGHSGDCHHFVRAKSFDRGWRCFGPGHPPIPARAG